MAQARQQNSFGSGDRRVLNLPRVVQNALKVWAKDNGRELQSVASKLVTWFLFQEEAVQRFLMDGPKAYPEAAREAVAKAVSEMITKRAAEIPDLMAAEAVDSALTDMLLSREGGKPSAITSDTPIRHRKQAS